MAKLYSAKRHEQELSGLRLEYEGRLKELQAAMTELKGENRRLAAEISLLEAQKRSISDAIIAASEKREEMQSEFEIFVDAEKALAVQAAEKAQSLLEDVRAAYPDEPNSIRFSAFERRLGELFGEPAASVLSNEENLCFFGPEADASLTESVPADEAAVHTELSFSASEPAVQADGEWDLKEVLATLGLDD